jgi:hypothetical protein
LISLDSRVPAQERVISNLDAAVDHESERTNRHGRGLAQREQPGQRRRRDPLVRELLSHLFAPGRPAWPRPFAARTLYRRFSPFGANRPGFGAACAATACCCGGFACRRGALLRVPETCWTDTPVPGTLTVVVRLPFELTVWRIPVPHAKSESARPARRLTIEATVKL